MVFVWDVAVSEPMRPQDADDQLASSKSPRHLLVIALVVILGLEGAALAAAAIYLIVELFLSHADSLPGAIALAASVLISAVWMGFIVVGMWRGMAWTRAAAVVVQVLLGAIAVGSLQGALARPDIGWLLLIPAVAVLALLFTRPVLAATSGRRSR
jgi:hypothetical protein